MQDTNYPNLYSSGQGDLPLLDDLDIIELYHQPGKNSHLSEITKKQRGLFEAMEIDVPA